MGRSLWWRVLQDKRAREAGLVATDLPLENHSNSSQDASTTMPCISSTERGTNPVFIQRAEKTFERRHDVATRKGCILLCSPSSPTLRTRTPQMHSPGRHACHRSPTSATLAPARPWTHHPRRPRQPRLRSPPPETPRHAAPTRRRRVVGTPGRRR